ncbi:MAG: Sec-independent protein translocase subunit TatB [Sulfurovum sp.]|nr:Sec-independent protein translocase subunit TatB [Sulfurovum sp.]
MFGMGFTEILFIAVIAIIFLGPDKLPEAMVQIAKFFNSFKKTVSEAKSSFENEIHMNELKEEALSYKKALSTNISGFKNSLSNPLDDLNEALSDLEDKAPDNSDYKIEQAQTEDTANKKENYKKETTEVTNKTQTEQKVRNKTTEQKSKKSKAKK